MRFGLQINPYVDGPTGNAWDAVERVARALEASAFDSLWLYDHFLYEGGYAGHPLPEPVLECFTALGAVAAITSRLRLGQLVLGVPYRNPAMTAKMATTLDLISHGRSILGLGSGWHQREYEAYGWGQFEPLGVRMRKLEEAVQCILKLWTERPASFEGEFYRLERVEEMPYPIQKPYPPIMIGGSGERVTMRLVAQYADWCNVQGDPEAIGRLLNTIRENCERLGRPYERITRSMYTTIFLGRDEADVAAKRERLGHYIPKRAPLIGTPEQIVDRLAAYGRVGIEYVIFRMPDWADLDPVLLFAERVIPALAEA